jgi:hypothetical protein
VPAPAEDSAEGRLNVTRKAITILTAISALGAACLLIANRTSGAAVIVGYVILIGIGIAVWQRFKGYR